MYDNTTKVHNSKKPKPVYMGLVKQTPKVGRILEVLRIDSSKGCIMIQDYDTSTVVSVEDLGNNIYKAITQNSIYIVQRYN